MHILVVSDALPPRAVRITTGEPLVRETMLKASESRTFRGSSQRGDTPSNREFETVPPKRFIKLSVHGGEVLANQQKALEWLHTPNPSLNCRTLLEATATDEGFQEADEVMTRIEFGVLGRCVHSDCAREPTRRMTVKARDASAGGGIRKESEYCHAHIFAHKVKARNSDQAFSAVTKDLKTRGLLE
jgi:hypothetical protein